VAIDKPKLELRGCRFTAHAPQHPKIRIGRTNRACDPRRLGTAHPPLAAYAEPTLGPAFCYPPKRQSASSTGENQMRNVMGIERLWL
jgi:hypothetical protein